ncbi:MAG: tetratricopeptide repeat protein, partial [Dehalococcoidia bacterium]
MKMFGWNNRPLTLLGLILVMLIPVFSAAGCQPGPQGYKSDPEAVQLNEAGMKLYDAGVYDKASLNFGKAMKIDPNNPALWFNNGQALDGMKKYDDAIDNYNQAIKLDPNFADAWANKALSYYDKQEYDQALDSINKAININGNVGRYWNTKGLIYFTQNKYN